jgi:hypothetical protein
VKVREHDGRSPAELVLDTSRATRALRRAWRRTLIDHKRRGDPIVIWEDGIATWVPADEIVIPEDDYDPGALT